MPIVKLDVPIPTEVPDAILAWIGSYLRLTGLPAATASALIAEVAAGKGDGAKKGKEIRKLMDRLGADFVVRREAVEAAK